MKKKLDYVAPNLQVEWLDEEDIVTASPSEFDGVGYIPDTWFFGLDA